MDVVRSNFEEVLPQIENALRKSAFVGMTMVCCSFMMDNS